MRVLSSFWVDIVDTFKKSLSSISWMDEESAVAAAEKVIPFIGHYTRIFLTLLPRLMRFA